MAAFCGAKMQFLRPRLIYAAGRTNLLPPIVTLTRPPKPLLFLRSKSRLLISHLNSDGFAASWRNFSNPAAHVNHSGSIDSPLIQSMEKKIKEHLNAESVSVKDAYGDGRHVCIDVVSSAFDGESTVNRQRMVYKAIWEELQSTVHAVDQMSTRTPNEAAAK